MKKSSLRPQTLLLLGVFLALSIVAGIFIVRRNEMLVAVLTKTCGNGVLDSGEKCDDGNTKSGDGCSSTCQIDSGYTCTAPRTITNCQANGVCAVLPAPSTCKKKCGDGILEAGEKCDDGTNNGKIGDGCSVSCAVVPGYICTTTRPYGILRSRCVKKCGDGILEAGEKCDDGNTKNYDGCSASCLVENTFTCTTTNGTPPSKCVKKVTSSSSSSSRISSRSSFSSRRSSSSSVNKLCGNHILDPGEQCDLAGTLNGYPYTGCTKSCKIVSGYSCTPWCVPTGSYSCPDGTQSWCTKTFKPTVCNGYSNYGKLCMCPDGYDTNPKTDTCSPCPANTYGQGGICHDCGVGISNPGSYMSQCHCPPGQVAEYGSEYDYNAHSAILIACHAPCPDGKAWNKDEYKCDDCSGGTVQDGQCICPSDKPQWKPWASGTSAVCTACPSSTPAWDGIQCTACPTDEPYWNGSKCWTCPVDTSWNGSKCAMNCPDGAFCLDPLKDGTCPGGMFLFQGECMECGDLIVKTNFNGYTKKCEPCGYQGSGCDYINCPPGQCIYSNAPAWCSTGAGSWMYATWNVFTQTCDHTKP